MSWQMAYPLAQLAGGTAKTLGADLSTPMKLLIAVGIVVASFVLGKALSKAIRMPEQDWRIGLIAFATLAGIVICVLGWPPKLGIDLGGGANMVYEVDQTKKVSGEKVDMDKLIAAVSERINPGGQREITIRPYGPEQIEIIVPEVDQDELARLQNKVSNIGTLEFRILANRRDHLDLIDAAEAITNPKEKSIKRGGKEVARWVPLRQRNGEPASGFLDDGNLATRGPIDNPDGSQSYEVLVVLDPFTVTGGYLTNTRASFDQMGRPSVDFRFNAQGASLFGSLTSENLPDPSTGFARRLGIILDGFMSSAPSIQSTIYDQGEITGDFTQEEVDDLVGVLNAGSLPTALAKEPVSSLLTSPTLGEDTIRKGSIAIAVSVVVVVLFMIFYYRFAGLVAGLAVVLNVVLTVAVAIAIQAPFSLAGLAGLALTLGMAVDANVLIYERMREEMSRGATLRMAIRNGFSRAMTTIIDSNVTTLIIAVVLYWIGTDQIKGFAVMLFLGLVISMFTACFCARVAFDICERQRWITQLRMRQLFAVPNFNYVSKLWLCVGISTVVVVVGLAGMWSRGVGMFNIDFIGGTVVEVPFTAVQDIATVREKVKDLPDVTVVDVSQSAETRGMRFKIETSLADIDKVEAELARLFPGQIATNAIVEEQVAMITPAEAESAASPAASESETSETGAGGDAPESSESDADASDASAPGGEGTATEIPESEEAGDAPAADESSARQRPSSRLLAAADAQAVLLALQDEPAGDVEREDGESGTDDEPTEAADDARQPADEPAADPPGSAETPAVESPADDAAQGETPPATGAGAESEAGPPGGGGTTTPGGAETGDNGATAEQPAKTASETDEYVGKTRARLQFREPITHDTLVDLVRKVLILPALKQKGVVDSVNFEVTNAQYVPGSSASYSEWDLRIALPLAEGELLVDELARLVASQPFFPSTSKVGSKVAESAAQNAITALLASFLFITIYLWIRFQKVTYGVAAVVALVHDVLVALSALAISYWLAPFLGIVMIEPFKIDLTVVAALLTIIGFSVNDTVVIFDRIREVKGKSPTLTPAMINDSVNQTLSRTVLTSLTVFLVTLILFIWGGPSIHAFAFTFLVGVITGTYSTIYVAAPILLWMGGDARRAESTSEVSATGVANRVAG
jgi:SecD/SecF fusion protein